MLLIAQTTVGVVALAVAGMAALHDLRERIIPNRLGLLLLALGMIRHALLAADWQDWLAASAGALLVAMLILGCGFVLWRLGCLGGGDVKLLAAAAFFVGPAGIAMLVAGTALMGGVLALSYLLVPFVLSLTAACRGPASGRAPGGVARPLPYGVAIAAGTAFAIVPTLRFMIG